MLYDNDNDGGLCGTNADRKFSRTGKCLAVFGLLVFIAGAISMSLGQEVAQTIPPVQVPVKIELTTDQIIEKSRQLGRLDVAIPMQEKVVQSAQKLLKELTDQRDALAKELGLDGKD
jgi:hypothetical protein